MTLKGVTQADLSAYCGISRPLISIYLKGRTEPSADKAQKIAEFFNVSLDWLICGIEDGVGTVREPKAQYLAGSVQELVEIFNSLNKNEQKTVLEMVRALKKKGHKF